jgi:hypothetical protein
VRGWVTSRRGRRIQTEGTLVDDDGVECVHAWAVFLLVQAAVPQT